MYCRNCKSLLIHGFAKARILSTIQMVCPTSKIRRLAMQMAINRTRASYRFCIMTWIAVLLLICVAGWMLQYKPSEYDYYEILSVEDFNSCQKGLPKQSEASSGCVSPSLPLFNKFINDNRPELIPADVCHKSLNPNWLKVSGSKIFIKPQFADATCSAEPILRINDFLSEFGRAQAIHNGSELPSLGFRATCTSPHSSSPHKSVYYGIKQISLDKSTKRRDVKSAEVQQDNIIILGLDSLSRLESLRSLPVVSGLMKSKLGSVTLKQYNIMGDGTPAALLPILTGVREEEMPESRRGFKNARYVDETMAWLFNHLRERGYVTVYGEEQNSYGTFQTRFLGFKKQPVDFYLRPVVLQQEPLQTDGICIGDEFASARMLSTVRDLFSLHPNQPKFAFLFFSMLSHENLDLSLMDFELTQFVNWFVRENLSTNTTLILMSDHGQRHGPMRNSMQGKLEESLPRMTISLSHQLIKERTAALKMLINNVNRLTTPVDIHKTLLSIARVQDMEPKRDAITSYSLIDESVPESRTCSQAGIPTHWCSCLSLSKVSSPNTDHLAVKAGQYAVAQINKATQSFRHLCHELSLSNINDAEISLASKDLARRERHVNWRYVAYDMENDEVRDSGYLNTRFGTVPNNGLFEATVQFSLQKSGVLRTLHLKLVGEASRINKYGDQAQCVATSAPHLRKFCYCRTTATVERLES